MTVNVWRNGVTRFVDVNDATIGNVDGGHAMLDNQMLYQHLEEAWYWISHHVVQDSWRENGTPPGILRRVTTNPISSFFKMIIKRLVGWPGLTLRECHILSSLTLKLPARENSSDQLQFPFPSGLGSLTNLQCNLGKLANRCCDQPRGDYTKERKGLRLGSVGAHQPSVLSDVSSLNAPCSLLWLPPGVSGMVRAQSERGFRRGQRKGSRQRNASPADAVEDLRIVQPECFASGCG
ncbi:hypothetical protein KSP40_PGU020648 [Platanthera guangdongensis]|uniref:Transposase n=1 Tax=Platanthera guangdongensis TaxID=2320717 RepID=A0ABR2M965_9ASPA